MIVLDIKKTQKNKHKQDLLLRKYIICQLLDTILLGKLTRTISISALSYFFIVEFKIESFLSLWLKSLEIRGTNTVSLRP